MKQQAIRLNVYKVICLAVKHHGHSLAAQITIMQSLQYYEHLSEPMAECLTVLAKEFDHAQLGDEILREIAGKSFNAQDTKGPRAFSRFLIRLAELAPRAVLKQVSLLLSHLDSEASAFYGTVSALVLIYWKSRTLCEWRWSKSLGVLFASWLFPQTCPPTPSRRNGN